MQDYYFKLPDKIFNEGFTPIEFVVYSFLNRVKDKRGQSYYSVPNIAKHCNIGETSCRKALTSLKENGYIEISKRYMDNVQLINIIASSNEPYSLIKSLSLSSI